MLHVMYKYEIAFIQLQNNKLCLFLAINNHTRITCRAAGAKLI
jgi:hypothetical protein